VMLYDSSYTTPGMIIQRLSAESRYGVPV
jgi:hypothetical protein